jgi:hypothetical protein
LDIKNPPVPKSDTTDLYLAVVLCDLETWIICPNIGRLAINP